MITMSSDGQRALLYELGARSLTKLLTLQDRNPHSRTYGCFDRNFWHLRLTDFPSGMAQEFVLPLAQAYAYDFPGNSFYGNPTVREWVRAGIEYAARSSHADGSCDDYYPFEKASGAAAFSLYAALRAIEMVQLDVQPFLPFLCLRAKWLAQHRESGQLSNHEALIANCLFRLAAITGEAAYAELAKVRLARLLSWQTDEGWFYEYQGCDPGYMSLTVANLAEIDAAHPKLALRDVIRRAVIFLLELQPPDGWLGGEWTSRNTNNYFPHGMEICGAWLPEALLLNSRVISGFNQAPDYQDDHIIAHHVWSYLLAAQAWQSGRPDSAGMPAPSLRHFPKAGYLTLRQGTLTVLVSLHKGGIYRLYNQQDLVRSDTGISLLVKEGQRVVNYVCHLWSDSLNVAISDQSVTISGSMGRAKASQMTPLKNIVLRALMLTLGRLRPDLVRRLLQRLLITGNSVAPFRFQRKICILDGCVHVEDRVEGRGAVVAAGIGPAQTSIYTVMSRVFHYPQLQAWEDISADLISDTKGGVTIERKRVYCA